MDVKCSTKHQYSSDLWHFENQAKLYCWNVDKSLAVRIVDSQANCWQITRSTFHSVFVMPNGAIRIKIPPFDSNRTNYGCQMYSITIKNSTLSDLWPLSLKAKRNCIMFVMLLWVCIHTGKAWKISRHIFQACPVWIHTRSTITNIIFTWVHNRNCIGPSTRYD
jgi:hypothetical protein